MRRRDARTAGLRIKGVAHPNDHAGFRRKRKDLGVKNFCAGGSESVSFVVAEFMEKACFGGFAGIGGEDAVHVGPDDQLARVHDMSDESTGKIGTVAAESGDAAIGSGADKAG